MSIWRELGIRRTRDRTAVTHGYAARLAEFDPEVEPARAAALLAAYERAHRFCDAIDSGAVPRIAPRRRGQGRPFTVQDDSARPRRASPARVQEAPRAITQFTRAITAPLHRGDQKTAVAALRGIFRDPLFGNLRLRWAVEHALLEELGALPELPAEFCLAAIAAFRWEEDPRHLPSRARAIAERLCVLAEGEKRVAGLRRLARFWALRMWFDRTALAAAILTGAYRPILFRLARFDPLTVRAVKRLLADIRTHHTSTAARRLDRRVIAWWDQALGVSSAPPARPDRAA